MSVSQAFGGRPRVIPGDPELRERDERLESLKTIVGKLAHDFNNFLVPQLGYVTLIKEDLTPDSAAAQYASTLEDSARKIEANLEGILLGMRPHRRFNPRPFDLGAVLAENVAKWESELPATAQISVRTNISPVPPYTGDPDQWANAFHQLLSNARFALATGGKLEVSLACEELAADKMAALGLLESKVIRICFKDDGFGMSPAALKRAFEPFFTTRTQVKVTGIGLTILHSVVQLHGGQVEVASAEETGTTVTIYTPFLTVPQLKPTLREFEPRSTSGKILLVDDDPLVREVLRFALQRRQRDVYMAQNGEEGLQLFKRHQGAWDLILSDVAMPEGGGIELVQAIRALDKEVRIILVSGDPSASSQMAKHLPEPKPLLIKKPFTLRAFNDVVRNYLGPEWAS
jgi:CheY-like chemotaxis protein